MASAQVIKNRRKDRKIFARVANRMNKQNLVTTNTRGGTRK